MVGMLKRMRRLNELLDIRLGPGAAIVASDVKRIHLRFAKKWNQGHFGPRKFWHTMLPRLKYHNPAVSMTVERTEDQNDPATVTIFFATPSMTNKSDSQGTPAPSSNDTQESVRHETWDKTHSIDAKGKTDSAILDELLKVTRANPVEATEEETHQLEELELQSNRSAIDRQRMRQVISDKRKEQEILRQARASMALKD